MSDLHIVGPLHRSVFGRDEIVHTEHLGKGGLIVAFGNKGYGIKPLWVGMPHQLYDHHIKKWAEQGYRQITVASVGNRELVAHDGSSTWGESDQ